MASIALGLIRPDGREPALNASTFSAPWIRANASAIWLRFEFSTHTKTTFFTSNPPSVASGTPSICPYLTTPAPTPGAEPGPSTPRRCHPVPAFSSVAAVSTSAPVPRADLFHEAQALIQQRPHAQVHDSVVDAVSVASGSEDA